MRIEFKELKIRNFKSIGEADIDLQSQGIVKVLGVNEYEDNAASNGSGKSSIFMALFWALYGRDPKGIINPSNRYTSGGCSVSLAFSIDNNQYQVIRSIKSGSQLVTLYINGEDKSARNRTDSDKIIRDDILRMSGDIFLSLIYLNQGFENRLTALTPSARKERLEQLTNTSQLIDAFSEKLSSYEMDVLNSSRIIASKKAEKQGFINSVVSMQQQLAAKLEEAINRIDYFEQAGKKYYRADIADLQCQIAELDSKMKVEQDKLFSLNDTKSATRSKLDKSLADKRSHEQNKSAAEASLAVVNQPASECPTCHQLLQPENADRLREQYSKTIKLCEAALTEIQTLVSTYEGAIVEVDKLIADVQTQIRQLTAEKQNLNQIVANIPLEITTNADDVKAQIAEMNLQQDAAKAEIDELIKEEVVYESRADVIKHCRQLVTKSFRAYLLESAVQFMNSRLKYYSSFLFSNEADIVRFDADSTKLEIYQGTVLYDTLSGGEERKADLAVVLAQRDLAAEIAGTSCNLLVLDEIMESMDEKATQVTLNLLEKTSESVDSMFIISHNNYAIPADSTLYVTKHSNRIATVNSNLR